MADLPELEALSVDDLLRELRARAGNGKPSESLRKFNDATVISVLKLKQKVIYGTDDRIDVFQLPAGPNLDWPAPGSEDTELGVLMELEVCHGETKVYPRVQA
jgi:hypothetical protein